jgi:transposase
MKMIELIPMVQDEKLSENYLREKGILKTFKNCEHCGSSKLGMIRSDRWKCYSCKAEWSRRRYSILSLVRMKYSEFLICLKCFEIEMTAERCSLELGIYLKTIHSLYTEFRKCICAADNEENFNTDKRIKGAQGSIGIRFLENKVLVQLPGQIDDQADSLISITKSKAQYGSTIFHFEFSNLRKHIKLITKPGSFSNLGTFWRFSNPRLLNFKGTRLITLLLYLKELEFRFNNKELLFELMVSNIAKNFRECNNSIKKQ